MASYRNAIRWIIENDDTEWLDGKAGTAEGQPSVTASLVADLFDKTDAVVRADLEREFKRQIRETRSRHRSV